MKNVTRCRGISHQGPFTKSTLMSVAIAANGSARASPRAGTSGRRAKTSMKVVR
jgi:hypothetical protein